MTRDMNHTAKRRRRMHHYWSMQAVAHITQVNLCLSV